MLKVKVLLFASLLVGMNSVSGPAHAYGMTRGAITVLRIDPSSNRVFLKIANATGGTLPACATGTDYTAAFSLTTANSQMFMELLISARQTGALVYVRGADTCTAIGNYEDVGYIVVQED